ncbi:hypothetical protein Aduo_004869 [Ancylostoma duodenale]
MAGSEPSHQSRRKCLKPVPLRDIAVDEEEPTRKREKSRKSLEPLKPDENSPNTPLLSEQASMDSLPINDAQSHPLPSSAELVKTSPRNSVKKTAVNETDETSQPLPQASGGARSKGQKRLPLSDATKKQAAKRNRLDGAISQLQARARVSSSPLQKKGCAENLQDPAPPVKEPQKASSTKEPQKPAPKKRRQRKTKENAAVGAKKTELDDNTKKKDEWKEHVRGLVKEVLNICGHSAKDNVAQAILDVLVDGVPLAISAARQGLSEGYLQNFVRATAVHIRQQCPELMQNLTD